MDRMWEVKDVVSQGLANVGKGRGMKPFWGEVTDTGPPGTGAARA